MGAGTGLHLVVSETTPLDLFVFLSAKRGRSPGRSPVSINARRASRPRSAFSNTNIYIHILC